MGVSSSGESTSAADGSSGSSLDGAGASSLDGGMLEAGADTPDAGAMEDTALLGGAELERGGGVEPGT
jgi:hypothetical protein